MKVDDWWKQKVVAQPQIMECEEGISNSNNIWLIS
jgi:hypothetical protein